MTTQELFNQIQVLNEEFTTNHNGTTKVSKGRARSSLTAMKKTIVEYKRASIAENK